ncbi:MAG: helix-turn-helix transcriptional regulator [Pseudomonadota bacterium]
MPSPIDIHIGKRLRLRRQLLGISQEKLGEQLGITFQQVQKYEKGINRISASRLFQIAHLVKVELDFFFEDIEPIEVQNETTGKFDAISISEYIDVGTLNLIKNYSCINCSEVQKNILNLVASLAKQKTLS